jgi:cysteine synthase B
VGGRPSTALPFDATVPPTVGERPRKAITVLDLIGNTPLVEIKKLVRSHRARNGRRIPPAVRVYAKLEGVNPGGSVKDRAALWMIRAGLESGRLAPGRVILDSTSGNTGIALAMIGAVLGYPVELVMPANVSQERKRIIAAYGAKIRYSDAMEGSDGAIRLCRRVLSEYPDRYFKPDQYFNPMNPEAHYESTGPEIWSATAGTVTHLIAGIGTGGTIMGTGRYLKERDARIQVIAAEPDDALHGLEGLKHMASSIVPGIYHEEQLDRKVPVGTEEAYETVYRLAEEDGIVAGQSAGAALWATLEVASELDDGVLVTIFPDFGDKYLSTNLWIGWQEWHQRSRRRLRG